MVVFIPNDVWYFRLQNVQDVQRQEVRLHADGGLPRRRTVVDTARQVRLALYNDPMTHDQ